MRRLLAVSAALLLLPLCAEGAHYTLQGEYRRDALDAEEEVNDFYRSKFRIFASPDTSAGAALSRVNETKILSWTWNALYDEDCSPVSLLIGNYYAQSGSGLLYGKLRPWNPDPFTAAAEISDAYGYTPCNSANPAFAFNGAACTFYPAGRNGNNSARIGASRTLRYAEEDQDHPSSQHASINTLLAHCSSQYPYTKALWCDTLTGSLLLHTGDYVTVEISALSLSCRNMEGENISWSRYETEGSWSAVKQMQGVSAFAAYNDGALRIFMENAFCMQHMDTDGSGRSYIHGFSSQGEISFRSRIFTGSVKGKSIGSRYGSPYFSTYGSRSPSQGIFMSLKFKPSHSLSFTAESSADKKTAVSQYSTEPSASIRESASLCYEPFRHLTLELSHAQTGSSYKDFPDKSRVKGETRIHFKNIKFSAAASQQKSISRRAWTAHTALQCIFFSRHSLSASAEYLHSEKVNPVPSSVLSEGGIPLFTAVSRTQVYAGSYSFYGSSITLKTKFAQQCSGKNTLSRRWELSGEGMW